MMDWLEPWVPVSDETERVGLEAELHRELGPGHVLFRRLARAIARRHDRDDVLFEVGQPAQFAVVHLTYAAHPEKEPWPMADLFDTLAAFVEGRMKPDHEKPGG